MEADVVRPKLVSVAQLFFGRISVLLIAIFLDGVRVVAGVCELPEAQEHVFLEVDPFDALFQCFLERPVNKDVQDG